MAGGQRERRRQEHSVAGADRDFAIGNVVCAARVDNFSLQHDALAGHFDVDRHREVAAPDRRQIEIPAAFDLGADVVLNAEGTFLSGGYVVGGRHFVWPRGSILLIRRDRIRLAELRQGFELGLQSVSAGRLRRRRHSLPCRVRWRLCDIGFGQIGDALRRRRGLALLNQLDLDRHDLQAALRALTAEYSNDKNQEQDNTV